MKFLMNFWTNKRWKAIVFISAMIVALFFISLIVLSSFKMNSSFVLRSLFGNVFNDLDRANGFINMFAYLLLASLATMTAFKYRIYNLGVIGQMIFGAVTSFVVARLLTKIGVTNKATIILLMLIAATSGMTVALIAGVFKTRFKINEMATTLLLNLIAINLYRGLNQWIEFNEGIIDNNASLIIQFNVQIVFSISILIALIIFIFVTILLDQRVFGFRLELSNINSQVASYAHLNPKRNQLIIMGISGAIAGLAGYFYFVGNNNKLMTFNPRMLIELDNILIPLWAFNSRIGIFFIALLISFLRSQIGYLQITNIDFEVINLLLTIFIILAIVVGYLLIWKKEPKILERWRIQDTLQKHQYRQKIKNIEEGK